jgi:hypothetical protein
VLGQTWRPIEIVIVDDASTDDTPQVADELARAHAEVCVIRRNVNGGAGAAREEGRLVARGDFIQHLDSDDVLLPRKFELQAAALLANQDCGAAYGWTRLRHADGSAHSAPWKRSGEAIAAMFPSMLQSRWWDTPTPLYRAEVIRAAGPWSDLRIEEDWEYDCRIAASGVKLQYVPEWVVEVRSHPTPQLSGGHQTPGVLLNRARAHALILGHARRAGIADDAPEMQHFARELFLLSRQCGAAGMPEESKMLFDLARSASGAGRDRLQFRIYAALARIAGWSGAGRIAALADRMRT